VQSLPAILFLLIAAVAIALTIAQNGRARTILDRWAARNGFEILEAERRYVRLGAFFFRATEGQAVFRVTIQDADDRVRRGYVKCGGLWLGVWSDQAVVAWDRDPAEPGGFPVILDRQKPADDDPP
jgi:hypothetical protein